MTADDVVPATGAPVYPRIEAPPEVVSALLHTAPVMVVWYDDDRHIRLINPQVGRLTGWSTEALAQDPLERLIPDPEIRRYCREVMLRADGSWLDIDLTCADGSLMPSSWSHVPLSDGTHLGIGVDTRRQAALRATLLGNIEQLSRVNQELEAFVGAASHDLREPVRSLISFSQLLERRLAGVSDQEVLDYLSFIVINARRLLDLVNALRTYARADQIVPLLSVDLGQVAREADQILTELKRESDGTIEIVPGLPVVHGDAELLREMLQNLIANGLRHHVPGTPPRVVIAPLTSHDGWPGFSLTDNGVGIPDTILQRGPLPFDRYGAPTVTAGTGLGLSLCQRILERHGGRMWFERPPQGTRVCVVLPPSPNPTPCASDPDGVPHRADS